MNLSDGLGWMAAGWMLLAFSCAGGARLRVFALLANVSFIGYAWMTHLHPLLVLHLALAPVNGLRLYRLLRTHRDAVGAVRRARCDRPRRRPRAMRAVSGPRRS